MGRPHAKAFKKIPEPPMNADEPRFLDENAGIDISSQFADATLATDEAPGNDCLAV
jgi:hypothetical protein